MSNKLSLTLALVLAVGAFATRAEAQSSCSATTWNSGAATVLENLYQSQCAVYSWSSGLVTKTFTGNCCVASVFIRVNGNDWNALVTSGKLDGLRYEKVSKTDAGYTLEFRKVTGTSVITISSEDFSK